MQHVTVLDHVVSIQTSAPELYFRIRQPLLGCNRFHASLTNKDESGHCVFFQAAVITCRAAISIGSANGLVTLQTHLIGACQRQHGPAPPNLANTSFGGGVSTLVHADDRPQMEQCSLDPSSCSSSTECCRLPFALPDRHRSFKTINSRVTCWREPCCRTAVLRS